MIMPAAVARLARLSVLSGHRSARRSPLWVLLLAAASSMALLYYVSEKERVLSVLLHNDRADVQRQQEAGASDIRSHDVYSGRRSPYVGKPGGGTKDPIGAQPPTARVPAHDPKNLADASAILVSGGAELDKPRGGHPLPPQQLPLLRAILAADQGGQPADGARGDAGAEATVPDSLIASWKQYLLAHKNDSDLLAEEAAKIIPNPVGSDVFHGDHFAGPQVLPVADDADSPMPDKEDQQEVAPLAKCDQLDKAYEQLYRWRSTTTAPSRSGSQERAPPKQSCPLLPPHLGGKIDVFRCSEDIADLEKLDFHVEKGGHYRPEHCLPSSKAAVIVPFRNRWQHLSAFLLNMHPYLQKQLIEYTVYVVNQESAGVFNKGILLNTGASLAAQLGEHDCFIFHDVDLYPENDLNIYRCPKGFLHLSVAVDKFDYKLPYKFLVGGALAVNKTAFEKINGYSNLFFGWGGEDDDLAGRIEYHGFAVKRHLKNVGSYSMMKHHRDDGNEKNPDRFHLLQDSGQRSEYEGLRSNVSRVTGISREKLFTFINVTFDQEHVIKKIHLDMLTAM